MSNDIDLLSLLPVVPDFPVKGVMFRDISPLLANATAFSQSILQLVKITETMQFDYIIGAEARGFVFAAALALHLNKGLILARKPGKLPVKTLKETYGLEYGKDALEIEEGLLPPASRVLLIDDVIATGGT
jgi:adenine phosphoribosyltransferase